MSQCTASEIVALTHDPVSQIYRLTLKCSDKRNALSFSLLQVLAENLEIVATSRARGLVIDSVGPTFCSGHDFKEIAEFSQDRLAALFQLSAKFMLRLKELPFPVCAAVQGGAVGAGCLLALSCDFIVAGKDAFFQTAGGAKGWFCYTTIPALQACLAPRRALEMLIKGQRVSAEQALDWGMINQIAENDVTAVALGFITPDPDSCSEQVALGKKIFYNLLNLNREESYSQAAKVMGETARMAGPMRRVNRFITK